MSRQSNTKEFIEKAKFIHNEKYDYSLVDYKKSRIPVKIICLKHGEFLQSPSNHLRGEHCRRCSFDKLSSLFKDTTESFIKKANEIHSNKYDYSKVYYVSSQTKIIIICSIHGEFKQRPNRHLQGDGCKLCSAINLSLERRSNLEEFIKKAKLIHNDHYSYEYSIYINNSTHIDVLCNTCKKIFKPTPTNHLGGTGCPYCNISSEEKRLYDWIKTIYNGTILQSDRKIIKPYELDIVLPDLKFAIEYNGIYWHSSKFKDKDYHINKTLNCKKVGYELWHIPSALWIKKPEIIKFLIKEKLKLLFNQTT